MTTCRNVALKFGQLKECYYGVTRPKVEASLRKAPKGELKQGSLSHLVVHLRRNPEQLLTFAFSNSSIGIFAAVLDGNYPEEMKKTAQEGLSLIVKHGLETDRSKAQRILEKFNQKKTSAKPAPVPITSPSQIEPMLLDTNQPGASDVEEAPAVKEKGLGRQSSHADLLSPSILRKIFYLNNIVPGELYSISVAFLRLFGHIPQVKEMLRRNDGKQDCDCITGVSREELESLVPEFQTEYSRYSLQFVLAGTNFLGDAPQRLETLADSYKDPEMYHLFYVIKSGEELSGTLSDTVRHYPKS
ncbi:MAG: hypothetical protein WCT39_00265 [Candidatus Margulisiibacteriota bacterium]